MDRIAVLLVPTALVMVINSAPLAAQQRPDLVVEAPRLTETSVTPGDTFRFGATVRNDGGGGSSATTLRYYRSSDSRITTSDTAIGMDSIGALSASATDRQSIGQRAPSTPGTYYYGACVDAVSGESDTSNNCSNGVPITVGGPAVGPDFDLDSGNTDPYGITSAQGRVYVVDRTNGKVYVYSVDGGDGGTTAPDLVVESPRSTESSVAPRGTFRFGATVRNSGDERSAATTLRYYRSSDSRITTSDTAIGTDQIVALAASETDRQTIGQRAPATPGTYYYGACVDSVAGESNTGNNCSSAVRVTVSGGGVSGTRYGVGDVITTLPSGSWFPNVCTGGCQLSGNSVTVNSRGGYFEYGSYRYTCEAGSCRVEGRTVARGTWLETRR